MLAFFLYACCCLSLDSPPVVTSILPKRAHEKRNLHARVHGETENMQQAANEERMHDASGRPQGGSDIFHPLLMLLRIAASFLFPTDISDILVVSFALRSCQQIIYSLMEKLG